MSDRTIGIPHDLALRLSGLDFGALEQWAKDGIERYKEQLSQLDVAESLGIQLRGRIATYREMLRLRETVANILQGGKKPVDDVK